MSDADFEVVRRAWAAASSTDVDGMGIESGVELDIPASWVVEVRDGKVA